jgi:hypothetical protein
VFRFCRRVTCGIRLRRGLVVLCLKVRLGEVLLGVYRGKKFVDLCIVLKHSCIVPCNRYIEFNFILGALDREVIVSGGGSCNALYSS